MCFYWKNDKTEYSCPMLSQPKASPLLSILCTPPGQSLPSWDKWSLGRWRVCGECAQAACWRINMNKDKRKASLQEVMTHEQEYWLPVLVPAMELINLFGAGGGLFWSQWSTITQTQLRLLAWGNPLSQLWRRNHNSPTNNEVRHRKVYEIQAED